MKTSQSVGKWVSVLYRHMQSYLKKSLEPYDIGAGQLPILLLLYRREHVKQRDLASRLQLDKTSLARTISHLEANGYLQRDTDHHDNRAYNISLTPRARKFRDDLIPILKNWTQILMQDFSPEERDHFISLLSRAADNAENALKRNPHDTA
jgi:DNA-binding MarR family transcriptional regulator